MCTGSLHTEWDNPTCTEGVVSVSRGEPAVMTCYISNPFSQVNICMMVPGGCEPIFWEVPQGRFSRGRWHLWIDGGVAQLETEEAQDTQAGQYKWQLVGGQRNIVFTTLNVSGAGRGWGGGRGEGEGRGEGRGICTPQLQRLEHGFAQSTEGRTPPIPSSRPQAPHLVQHLPPPRSLSWTLSTSRAQHAAPDQPPLLPAAWVHRSLPPAVTSPSPPTHTLLCRPPCP